jgi:hypothetical protein
MNLRLLALTLCLVTATAPSRAGQTTWDRNAVWLQEQIEACARGTAEFACRYFPARALNQLFGIDEFCTAERCLLAHEIAVEIGKDGHWSTLGRANDQAILTQAQEMAIGGLPVIAVQAGGDKGLIAIIMPGKLAASQRWSRNVPMSVGTRLDKPEDSIYGKGLNFLFSDPAKVMLYAYK